MSFQKRFQTMIVDPLEHESAVDMRDGRDVPGIAGERARFETWKVIDEMGDDNFHEFVREKD